MKHSDWFRRGFKVTQRSSQKIEITCIYACTPIKGLVTDVFLIVMLTSEIIRISEKYLDGILAMLRMHRSRHPLRVVSIKADGAFEAVR
jgi:hypothetical protein